MGDSWRRGHLLDIQPWHVNGRGAILRRRGRREGHRASEPEDVRQPRPDPAGRLAAQLHDTVKQVDQVSAVAVNGGQRRQMRVDLDETRLAGYHLSPSDVAGALGMANRRLPAGSLSNSNREFVLEAGSFLTCADDVRRVVVGVVDSRPVFPGDVVRIEDGGEEHSQYVRYASAGDPSLSPAVTLAVSKRKGANAIEVADRVLARVNSVRGAWLPSDVQLSITRNYGETAAEKSNGLLFHMFAAPSARLEVKMVRYSFLVGLFHPRLHAGLSRRLHLLTRAARIGAATFRERPADTLANF